MTSTDDPPDSYFSLLAIELRQAILCEVSDIQTLETALKTDASLQSAFSDSPSLILGRIVHNIVPSEFLPEVHVCLASRHFNRKTWSKDQVLKILDNYFQRQIPEQSQWGLDEVRFVSNLHQDIQLFVEEFSFSDALWSINSDDMLLPNDEEKKRLLAKHSATNDPDPGPYNAWFWAHLHPGDHMFLWSGEHKPLRRRGYVMWDHSRLVDEWNLFSKPYEAPEGDAVCGSTYSREYMKYSYKRRPQIFDAGGTGWWSKDDESKIVWPKEHQ